MERALEVERARHASEMERALEAEWAQQASEIEEHSRVSGHDKSHKWMRSWRHGLKLCPILAKWSHCSASRYPCSESLMITQRQTKIMHIIWMWYRLLITNQIIINGFFFFVVWLHLFKFTRCSMLRTWYDSIILFANYICFIIHSSYRKCCEVTRSWKSWSRLILGNILVYFSWRIHTCLFCSGFVICIICYQYMTKIDCIFCLLKLLFWLLWIYDICLLKLLE